MASKFKQPAPLPRSTRLKEYHVYDPNVRNTLGGQAVMVEGDKRTVHLTEAEAQYFIDQNIIGEKPFDQLSEEGQRVVGQGLKLPGHAPDPETSENRRRRRERIEPDSTRSPVTNVTTGAGDTVQGPGQKGRRS